jgi:hypothetical protein
MAIGLENYLWLAALLIVLTTSCQPTSNSTNQESADLVITNAKIFTSNKQQPWAEALAIKDGKFIYVHWPLRMENSFTLVMPMESLRMKVRI